MRVLPGTMENGCEFQNGKLLDRGSLRLKRIFSYQNRKKI